jgi:hypothetical protein
MMGTRASLQELSGMTRKVQKCQCLEVRKTNLIYYDIKKKIKSLSAIVWICNVSQRPMLSNPVIHLGGG